MAVAMRLLVLLAAMAATAIGKSVKNPADALAREINRNLTAANLPTLYNNPGLGCVALQYIQAYQGQCSDVGPNGQRPPEASFKTTLADNCGVDPSSVADITGTILACETEYRDARYAFSSLLFKESSTLATLQSSNHTEFGVGISGYEGGAPYFWCVLLSNGTPKSSFSFSDSKAKYQKTGCFSGTGEACSGGAGSFRRVASLIPASMFVADEFGLRKSTTRPWRKIFWFSLHLYFTAWSIFLTLVVGIITSPFRFLNAARREKLLEAQLRELQQHYEELGEKKGDLERRLEVTARDRKRIKESLDQAVGEWEKSIDRLKLLKARVRGKTYFSTI
ncbi:hypothetical protein SELMODRAFT_440699 [Selaginella moellendorffii]|uniref:SCP domain-containing protein n=1 Tax=Selaginella moellendorffii TaxID=88036 RepID=D8RDS4_SELML|nr:hypothetical protein SELMODRAFT_440699 [Selaginella moellendorffii]